MPKKVVSAFDLLKDFSAELRTKADTVGLDKYQPMDAQRRFHECTTQGRMYSGGNRAGKTVGGVAEDVKWLTGKHEVHSKKYPPPIRGRVCAVDFDKGIDRVIIPEFKKWMPTDLLIEGQWEKSYKNSTRLLTLTNGSTCEFMSYDQDVDKFSGTSRHFIHFDEEPPKAIFTECLARLIDTDGMWWMTMTPLIEFSWTADDLYEPIKDGRIPFITLFEVNTEDNIHIKKEALDQLTFVMDEDEQMARKTGRGYSETSLIFPELKDNIIPPVGPKDLKGYQFFTSKDHGLRNPTCILFFAIGPEDDIIVFDEYYEPGRLVAENSQAYKALVSKHEISISYMVGDPSTQNRSPITGTSIQQEYGEHGVWYFLGNNDVRAGLLRVKSVFKAGRLKIGANCKNTIREARTYKWKKPISSKVQARNNLLEEPVKKNDHAMDALRYGIMTIPQTEEEIEEEFKERMKSIFPDAVTTASVWDKANTKPTQIFDEHLGDTG